MIVGYKDGLVRIIDSEKFEKILFEEKLADGEVESVLFHLDKYANLRVTHVTGATTNLILTRNVKEKPYPVFNLVDEDHRNEAIHGHGK